MSDAGPISAGRLSGRVALVTGGSTGIGAAIVRAFAQEGARVVFCARSEQPGTELAAELRAAGRDVVFVRADATSEFAVASLVDSVVNRHGGLDILVNNAAVSKYVALVDMATSDWETLLKSNLTSMFLATRACVPHLRRSSSACIVNLGSTYSFIGAPGAGAYGMTKAAAVSFTKTLALELAADRIRVNALCPGATATRLYDDYLSSQPNATEAAEAVRRGHPLGRIGLPSDMAKGALYLASDESSFVTGHALVIDGGHIAQ